ncbi:MAG TPA: hypothetical protein VI138_04450 [Candidatus Dormibacteraeota bacterium]
MTQALAVGVETGSKRAFAWAAEWPGWCRSGRGEAQALQVLAQYADRYREVAFAAGEHLPAVAIGEFKVQERLPGSATTDFGAPAAIGPADVGPLTPAAGERIGRLLGASWDLFEARSRSAPPELRKGPRGGGRDRDKMVAHVLGVDFAYARKLGLDARSAVGDEAAVVALRKAVRAALASPASIPATPEGWPPRYYARRAAWHVLDHLWEIEDRS